MLHSRRHWCLLAGRCLLAAILLTSPAAAQASNRIYVPMVRLGGEPAIPASSLDRIDQAEAAGTITHEQALAYSVYALFGDPRLPAHFAGAASEDSQVMAHLRAEWHTLSAGTQSALAPFLLPPPAPGSWYSTGTVSAAGLAPQAGLWATLTAGSGVKVWYNLEQEGDAAKAAGLVTAIDAVIYPRLVELMGRAWLSDAGQSDDGGDGMLDVYLVRDEHVTYRGLTTTYDGCEESPAWIVLTSDKPLGDATTPGMVHTAAHEMLHAVQYSYPLQDPCETYAWLQEATSKWFEHYTYPAAQSEHEYAPVYLSDTQNSLEAGPQSRTYSAYLYPFFLTETLGTGEPVRRMWENAASMDSLSAVDQSGASFADHWKGFALANWNQGPESRYQTWDDLTAHPQQPGTDHDVSGVTQIWEYLLPSHLEHLSIQYRRYRFTDQSARTVVFYNGLTHELAHDDGQAIPQGDDSVTYYSKGALPAEDVAALSVQALIKFEGNPLWEVQDWTAKPFVAFCRDKRAERIEELVLILANSEHDPTDPNYDFTARGVAPTLLISPVGCWRWQGWAEMWTATGVPGYVPRYDHVRVDNIVWEPVGWDWRGRSYHVASATATECTLHYAWFFYPQDRMEQCVFDSTTCPTDVLLASLISYSGVTSGSLKGAYTARAYSTSMHGQLVCLDMGSPDYPPYVGPYDCASQPWLYTDNSDGSWGSTVTPAPTLVGGTLMQGSHVLDLGFETWVYTSTWHFESVREP